MNWLTIITLLLTLGLAQAQNEGAHGGDPLAAEFIARGYYIYAKLASLEGRDRILDQAELALFSAALKETRIQLTTAQLVDQGGVVSAKTIDDPLHPGKKLIQLNRIAWKELLQKDRIDLNRFVFHEYLRAIAKDDENYKISRGLDLLDFALPRETQTLSFKERVTGAFYTANYGNLTQGNAMAIDSFSDETLDWMAKAPDRIQAELGTKVRVLDIKTDVGSRQDLFFGSDIGSNQKENCRRGVASLGYCEHLNYDALFVVGGPIPKDYLGSYLSIEDPFPVGFRSSATATINVVLEYGDPLQRLTSQPILGQAVTYDIPFNPGLDARKRIATAWAQAYNNFQTACQNWKRKIYASAIAKKEVRYADCGEAELTIPWHQNQEYGPTGGYGGDYTSGHYLRTYRAAAQYISNGTVYFSSH